MTMAVVLQDFAPSNGSQLKPSEIDSSCPSVTSKTRSRRSSLPKLLKRCPILPKTSTPIKDEVKGRPHNADESFINFMKGLNVQPKATKRKIKDKSFLALAKYKRCTKKYFTLKWMSLWMKHRYFSLRKKSQMQKSMAISYLRAAVKIIKQENGSF